MTRTVKRVTRGLVLSNANCVHLVVGTGTSSCGSCVAREAAPLHVAALQTGVYGDCTRDCGRRDNGRLFLAAHLYRTILAGLTLTRDALRLLNYR